jgi:hypothetical protein
MSDRVFTVSAILDKTTLVITGSTVKDLWAGQKLLVLAVGQQIPGSAVPLVVPKARVEVTVAAGAYVLARPETQDVLLGFQTGLTRRRPALDVDEGSLLGNPGSGPIKVGDPVILEDSLAEYVASITEP